MEKAKRTHGKAWYWWQFHKPSKRRVVQLLAALLYNCYAKGWITGTIFKGETKAVCVPGMNCYSCPGAVGSCPIGSLQSALQAENKSTLAYVGGIIALYGLIFGRFICGWLCPGGLIQDLLYKIKSPKIQKGVATRVLSYLKYVALVLFVVMITLGFSGAGAAVPAFCKYLCPLGTLEGAWPMAFRSSMAESLKALFTWKSMLVCLFLVSSVFLYRPFCRFLCPLGAIYGLFSPIALLGVKVNEDKCIHCGLCVTHCKMDIHHVGDRECVSCGDCVNVCPTKAIEWKGGSIFLKPNAIAEGPSSARSDAGLLASASTASEAPREERRAESKEEIKLPARRHMKKRFWIPLAIVIALGGSYLALLANMRPAADINVEPLKLGEKLPSTFSNDLYKNGDHFSASDADGKVLIVNFWYTTCGGCVAELPEFNEVASHHAEDAYFLVLDTSYDTYEEGKNYVEQHWPDYVLHFGYDVNLRNATLMGAEKEGAYPFTAIFDVSGILRYASNGSLTGSSLEEYIQEYKTVS